MYRNVVYNPFKKNVFLRTWNSKGKRVHGEIDFNPYLFIEQAGAKDGISIFGTPLAKKVFNNTFERNEFVKQFPSNRIFFNLPAEQQFLIEWLGSQNEDVFSTLHPLKIFFFDIEVDSSKDNIFPSPRKADHPINLITVFDSLSKQFHTWGLSNKPYNTKSPNSYYYSFTNEEQMLEHFVSFWRKDYPDIVSGWSSDFFDIPYLINRISNVLGEHYPKKLSPVGRIRFREFYNELGLRCEKWYIAGISCIDYLEAYKTFSLGEKGSYKLNDIAEYEINEKKIAFDAVSLSEFAKNDWDRFVDYNIQDVNLIVKLEEKLRYLEICRLLAYKGFTNFEAALGKISIVTGAVSLQAYKRGLYSATFKNNFAATSYPGGYVKDPERGLQKSIVTFDVNSLYPNTIITLNISPETKLGNIVTDDVSTSKKDTITLRLTSGETYTLNKEKFYNFIQKEKVALSKSGTLYSQKKRGIIPQLIDKLYSERAEAKKHALELKKQLKDLKEKNLATEDIEQQIVWNQTLNSTLKVLLNSIYGVFANDFSPLLDIDNAKSITITGQEVAKAGADILDKAIRTKYRVDPKFTVVAQDTDSVMITIESVLQKKGIKLTDDEKRILPECYEIVEELSRTVNEEIIEWAKRELYSIDPRYVFKREAIADVGLFLQKKRYALHILDNEGVKEETFKYVGIEMARSTIPPKVKKLIKQIIDTAILTQDYKATLNAYLNAYEEFTKFDLLDIAINSTANNVLKYGKETSLGKFKLGTPYHIKAVLCYNILLDVLRLDRKYEKIKDGQKVKVFYTEANKYNISAIAFPGFLPSEFGLKPDYRKMFEITVHRPAQRIFETIGWPQPSIDKRTHTDLFTFFSAD